MLFQVKKTLSYGIGFVSLLGLLSCEREEVVKQGAAVEHTQHSQTFRAVTDKEYAEASQLEKRIIDQLDASVNALDIMAKNKDFANYEAVFSVSNQPSNGPMSGVVIAPIEEQNSATTSVATAGGSCHVCGMSSAYSCIRAIGSYMDAHHTNDVNIHAHRTNDGCVDITYN